MAKRATSRAESEPKRAGLAPIDGDASAPLALDRLIHERVRLALVSALAVHEMLSFNELKALLEDHRRQPLRPRQEARGSRVCGVPEVLRRTHPPHRVPAYSVGAESVGAVSGAYGGTYQAGRRVGG